MALWHPKCLAKCFISELAHCVRCVEWAPRLDFYDGSGIDIKIHSNCERKPCPLWAGRHRAKDKFLIFLQTKQVAMSIIPNAHYSEDDFESETHNGRGSA